MEAIYNVVKQQRCTGCGACKNVCPVDAIKMIENENGFYQPEVDFDKCINCKLCDRVCPADNVLYSNSENPDCYALMADDEIRARSSSGGAFEIIAGIFLEKGGYVCGVAYKDGFHRVEHILINNKKDIDKLHGSKYIMSDTGDIYRRVKNLLQKDIPVLFSGCPCQVAGLKNYLGEIKNSEKLLTVDIICHGVPSFKAFDKYIQDEHGNKEITYLNFKDKSNTWAYSTVAINFSTGEQYKGLFNQDDFYDGYLKGVSKNYACGKCIFARVPRQGDITIGDFWGISRYEPKYNDTKGTSVVLLNNDKGCGYYSQIKEKAKLFVGIPLQVAINGNSNLIKSPSINKSVNQFFKNLDNKHYHELVRWSLMKNRYDIGIVGIPLYPNFGGALTYYGLYRALRDMNYSAALFSRPRSTGKPPIKLEAIYTVNPYDSGDLHLDYSDKKAMSTAGDWVDTFVVGSDQLFNADLYTKFGEIVTLDWISDNHRKVAYAASFGHSYFWGDERKRAKMAHYMQKFDAFSVREEDGVALAKQTFGVDAEWVMDPVFLCDKKHYELLAEQSGRTDKTSHIFAYILDPSQKKETILKTVVNQLKLPVELYSEMLYLPTQSKIEGEKKKFETELLQGNVNERLYSLINSDYIVADSFHGICFAIIFRKPFIAILNPLRGATRFYTILGKLNLLDRLVTSPEELEEKSYLITEPLDYSEAEKLLNVEVERSLNWLKEAVSPQAHCKKAYSTEDLLGDRFKSYERLLRFENIKNNAVAVNKKFYLVSDIKNYLQLLAVYQDELIIDIAVKDTPGFSFTTDIDNLFKQLGLKQSLVDKHWQSYIAVLNGKTVVNEQLNGRGDRIAYVGNVNNIDLKTVSISFTKGNLAANIVNGVEYSENRRGINIVVIDKNTNLVIDSVCFDTHDPQIPCSRFGKKSDIDLTAKLLEGMLQGQQQEINACLDRLNAVERENAAAASKLEAMTSRYETLDAEYNQLKGSHAALENSFAQAESALAQKQRELEQSVKENSDLKAENQSANARLQELEAHYTDIQKSLSFRTGRAITFIPRKIRNLFKKK